MKILFPWCVCLVLHKPRVDIFLPLGFASWHKYITPRFSVIPIQRVVCKSTTSGLYACVRVSRHVFTRPWCHYVNGSCYILSQQRQGHYPGQPSGQYRNYTITPNQFILPRRLKTVSYGRECVLTTGQSLWLTSYSSLQAHKRHVICTCQYCFETFTFAGFRSPAIFT